MKRYLTIVCSSLLWLLPFTGSAQEENLAGIQSPRPVQSILTLEIGSGKVRDTYLAPLAYEGANIGIRYERWRLMRSFKWYNQQIIEVNFVDGEAENGGNSEMYAWRSLYRYAMHRQVISHLFVGGYAGAELGADYNLKLANGNNPASIRLAGNIGASVVGKFGYKLRGKDCMLWLQAQAPLVGTALMPEYGASYYETFMLKTSDNNAHLTSLHNQQDLDMRVSTEIPVNVIPWFKRSSTVLTIGGAYHIETMAINDITQRFSHFSLTFGWTWKYLPIKNTRSLGIYWPE